MDVYKLMFTIFLFFSLLSNSGIGISIDSDPILLEYKGNLLFVFNLVVLNRVTLGVKGIAN